MIQPITDRSQIDAALASFVAALREAGLDERADAIDRVSSDAARAEVLGCCMSGVKPDDRKLFLHRAARSLQLAYGALATAALEQQRVYAALEGYGGPGGSR